MRRPIIAPGVRQAPMSKVDAPHGRDTEGVGACRGTKQVRRVCQGRHRATTSGGARESAAEVYRSMMTITPPHLGQFQTAVLPMDEPLEPACSLVDPSDCKHSGNKLARL